MAETVQVATPKIKSKPAAPASAFETPKFEMPKFEMPKFDMPNIEMPAAFRELAEKGVAQAKDNYEKIKSAAEQATDMLEDTYSNASKGASDYGLKVIETARANSNAAFNLFGELLTAKTLSEVVEKSTAYMRTQFETMTAQAKELTEQAQKVAAQTAEPIKETISTFHKAA
jgi:phasin